MKYEFKEFPKMTKREGKDAEKAYINFLKKAISYYIFFFACVLLFWFVMKQQAEGNPTARIFFGILCILIAIAMIIKKVREKYEM